MLAARLSDDPHTNVLLLEAGMDTPPIKAPFAMRGAQVLRIATQTTTELITLSLQMSPWDWQYRTEALRTAGKANLDRKVSLRHVAAPLILVQTIVSSGKGMGGSSAISFMLFSRGSSLSSSDMWTDDVNLKNFKHVEHFSPDGSLVSDPDSEYPASPVLRGRDGPMPVRLLEGPNVLTRAFVRACVTMLRMDELDYNGRANRPGVSLTQNTVTVKGERATSADTYLPDSVRSRPNLDISPLSMVETLAIQDTLGSSDGKVAVGGVNVRRLNFNGTAKDKVPTLVRATEEVILSAGAIASPQILLRDRKSVV